MASVRIKLRTNENTIRIKKPQVLFTGGGIEPSGTIEINANGVYNVKYYEFANVNVPIPEGYLKPEGTFETNIEGTYDVTPYSNATFIIEKEQIEVTPNEETQTLMPSENKYFNKVFVKPIPSQYIIPSGSLNITTNGTYDVTNFASVNINVAIPEGYLKPSGTLEVTENGEHDVATYEKVNVNVQSGNTLKKLLDNRKSCYYLFYQHKTDNVADLIQYSDTENVTDMSYMFYGSNYVPLTIPLLNTSKVTNMSSMFNGCNFIEELPLFDTSKVTNMSSMFASCNMITTIPLYDTSSVTNMSYMFNRCNNITTMPLLNTSSVTNMSYMFSNCPKFVQMPLLDTSNVTNMGNMFEKCTSLITIPALDTSNVTSMYSMFNGCTSLTSIPQLDTSSVTNINNMFYGCSLLKKVEISDYNYSSTSYVSSTFNNCYSLRAFVIRKFGEKYVLNSNTFANCYHILGTQNSIYNPNGDKDGYIYVPRDMIETLSIATNWSTYASQFRALEDYTLDGTTTGELDLAKMGLEELIND